MILGIGIDILRLQRLAQAIQRRGSERIARRILGEEELREWRRLNSKNGDDDCEEPILRYLAVR